MEQLQRRIEALETEVRELRETATYLKGVVTGMGIRFDNIEDRLDRLDKLHTVQLETVKEMEQLELQRDRGM